MKPLAIAVGLLLLGVPALASPPDYTYDGDRTYDGRTPANAVGSSVDSQGMHPQLDTCMHLMEQAFYLRDPASLDRAVDARHEMELARDAYHDGDAFACKRHAIHALEDRT